MFLKIKRLKHLEDLLLESNIIRIGDEFNDISADATKQNTSGSDQANIWSKMDMLVDSLLDQGIIDLDKELDNPTLDTIFGTEQAKATVEGYLEYCKKRIAEVTARLTAELQNEKPDHEEIKKMNIDIVKVSERINTLDKIYEALQQRQAQQLQELSKQVLEKIAETRQSIVNLYLLPAQIIGQRIKQDTIDMESIVDPEEKAEKAASIADDISTLNAATEILPETEKAEIAKVISQVESTVEQSVGAEQFSQIKSGIVLNRIEAGILKRIVQLNYTDFQSIAEIDREVNAIKISINGLESSTRGYGKSKKETIEYLLAMLDEAHKILLAKARDKSLEVDKTKGIHFDFNKKLKLYEKVELPVTGKQIADATLIMRFRKGFQSLMDFLFSSSLGPSTPAGEAFANFGEQLHKIYAVTLNKSAKVIGKTLKGREGEMKADALSRLFIPGTEVLDKDKAVKEDGGASAGGVAPGVSPQVPGSVGGMGAIKAPTSTIFGSGDNFNPTKTKDKKKKNSMILDFKNFVRENNINR